MIGAVADSFVRRIEIPPLRTAKASLPRISGKRCQHLACFHFKDPIIDLGAVTRSLRIDQLISEISAGGAWRLQRRRPTSAATFSTRRHRPRPPACQFSPASPAHFGTIAVFSEVIGATRRGQFSNQPGGRGILHCWVPPLTLRSLIRLILSVFEGGHQSARKWNQGSKERTVGGARKGGRSTGWEESRGEALVGCGG